MIYKYYIGQKVIDLVINIPVKIVGRKISYNKKAVYRVKGINNINRRTNTYNRYEFELDELDPVGPSGGPVEFTIEEIIKLKHLVKDKEAIIKIGKTRMKKNNEKILDGNNDNNLEAKTKGITKKGTY